MTDDDAQAWRFQAIVEGAPEAIIAANPEGVIRLWSPGAEAMFGYRADEALGQRLDLIIPEAYRERHWTGFYSVMQTGTSRYGRQMLAVPALRKDGTRISIEFHVVVLHDPAGALAGWPRSSATLPSAGNVNALCESGSRTWRQARPSGNALDWSVEVVECSSMFPPSVCMTS
jgi:PAS domain S-box-containing protein